MQERYIFREMLSEIKELADQKGNVLTLDEVKEFFKNAHLTDEQLNMVCVYLIGEKIRVEGYEGPENRADAGKGRGGSHGGERLSGTLSGRA